MFRKLSLRSGRDSSDIENEDVLSPKARKALTLAKQKSEQRGKLVPQITSIGMFKTIGLELKLKMTKRLLQKIDILLECCNLVYPEPYDIIVGVEYFEQMLANRMNFQANMAFLDNLANISMERPCAAREGGLFIRDDSSVILHVELNEELRSFIQFVVNRMIIVTVPDYLIFKLGVVNPSLLVEARSLCDVIKINAVTVCCKPADVHQDPIVKEDMFVAFDYTG
jgi:hypothetical protein